MTAEPDLVETQSADDARLPKPVPTTFRRRGAAVALGLTIVIVGALAFTYVLNRFSETVEVIRVTNDLPRGSEITRDDVSTAAIVTDPALNTLPGERIDEVVGLRASTDLVEGTLLTDASLSSEVVPGQGERLVGVAVTPSQLPGEPLIPGDTVHVVHTPGNQELGRGDTPTVEGTVLAIYEPGDDGRTKIDVLVGIGDAFMLARLVATENLTIVLESREQ